MHSIVLPLPDRRLERYTLGSPRAEFLQCLASNGSVENKQAGTRTFFSAAHVVANPLTVNDDPTCSETIDWDKTLAFREHLWDLGLGVAEAMDTAQRGMGLNWHSALQLIKRSAAFAKTRSDHPLLASGAGTDHLLTSANLQLNDVIAAYLLQCEAVEATGSRIILMASRALAAIAKHPDDYARVYDAVLSNVAEPVILHWLGDMFDPALAGYWGKQDHAAAMEVALDIIHRHANKIDGIKISLLSAEKEVLMRRCLPANVRMYTGDDFNFPELIAGDDQGYSHALLGIFAAIAPAAAAAQRALQNKDTELFYKLLNPTVPLSRHIFKAPTRFYKTGVVFMAYLNGYQSHFTLLGGQHSARSLLHLVELFKLADQAGLLLQPELACLRMQQVLAVHGIGNR